MKRRRNLHRFYHIKCPPHILDRSWISYNYTSLPGVPGTRKRNKKSWQNGSIWHVESECRINSNFSGTASILLGRKKMLGRKPGQPSKHHDSFHFRATNSNGRIDPTLKWQERQILNVSANERHLVSTWNTIWTLPTIETSIKPVLGKWILWRLWAGFLYPRHQATKADKLGRIY